MAHRELPTDGGWYAEAYASDPSSDNPFGREDRRETSNRALHSHLRAGGSILTFPRAAGGDAARTALSAALDRALSKIGGAK